jgi:hypothetical protein
VVLWTALANSVYLICILKVMELWWLGCVHPEMAYTCYSAELFANFVVSLSLQGDLGVECAPEDVPILQKQIIDECREQGKPVVVATQVSFGRFSSAMRYMPNSPNQSVNWPSDVGEYDRIPNSHQS